MRGILAVRISTMCERGSGMSFRNSLGIAMAAMASACAGGFSYRVIGDANSWDAMLTSIGFVKGSGDAVVVAPVGVAGNASEWTERIEHGTILVLEGESPLASSFGFRPTAKPHVMVRSVEDVHAAKL